MDKLKYIKLENEDGSYSNSIPLAVDSDHVDVNGNTLTNELSYKANNSSINDLQINKINKTDIVDNLNSTSATKVLSANQGKILDNKITTSSNLKIDKNDIIDNLDSTNSTKVLSAKQGNILNGYINTINTTLTNKANINDIAANYESKTEHNNDIANLSSQINGLASGSPLVASSVAGMTNTNKIYVNTSDGHWYWHNGTTWVDGGIYQATQVDENDPVIEQTLKTFDQYVKDNCNEIPIDLEKNSIDFITGANSTNGNRARTKDYYKFNSNMAIFNIPNDYGCMIFEYDSEKNYLKYYGYSYGYGSFNLNVDPTHYYRIMVRHSDNRAYESMDFTDFHFYEYVTKYQNNLIGEYQFKNVSDLVTSQNNMVLNNYVPFYTGTVEVGTIQQDGTEGTNNNRLRSSLVNIPFIKLKIVNTHSAGTQYICWYNNSTYVSNTVIPYGTTEFDVPQNVNGIRLLYGGYNQASTELLNKFEVYGKSNNSCATKEYVDTSISNRLDIDSDYLTEYENVKSNVLGNQTKDTLSFAFLTDLHINNSVSDQTNMYKQICKVVKKFADETNLMFVAFGGDNTDNIWYPVLSQQKLCTQYVRDEMIKELNVPLFIAKGNHDDNSIRDNSYNGQTLNKDNQEHIPTKTIYDYELENYYTKFNENKYNIVVGKKGYNYLYADFPEQKIRVFLLNSVDIPYDLTANNTLTYTGQWTYGYRNDQLNFVANALKFSDKDNPNDWTSVFIKHHSVNPTYYADAYMHNSDILVNIINAYQTGSSYTASSSDGDFPYNINVDYTGQTGKVIDIAGHWHIDANGTYSNIPFVISTTARYTSRIGDLPTAFDIVTIDTKNRKAYFTRFGYGNDREINY